jgi:hypothetical protein
MKLTTDYQESTNIYLNFLNECTIEKEDGIISTKTLYLEFHK